MIDIEKEAKEIEEGQVKEEIDEDIKPTELEGIKPVNSVFLRRVFNVS